MTNNLKRFFYAVMPKTRVIFLMIIFMIMASHVLAMAQGTSPTQHVTFSFAFGNWQPHTLNDEPSFDTFGAAGATPFWNAGFLYPLGKQLGIRLSVGYWSLRDLEEVERIHSLVLHPISLDMKHWLIPDYILSAFVMYGVCVTWGIENETLPFGTKLRKAQAGYGGNLGAGFDLALSKYFGLGMSFQYVYLSFKNALGGVREFSGPRITGLIYIYL